MTQILLRNYKGNLMETRLDEFSDIIIFVQ